MACAGDKFCGCSRVQSEFIDDGNIFFNHARLTRPELSVLGGERVGCLDFLENVHTVAAP